MKTFRKSSLIASVALLLVAIVALGGATFAWFSSNTQVTASKIEIASKEASGIYIAGTAAEPKAADWKSELVWTYDEPLTLNPVSGAFANPASPKFYSTVTDKADGIWNGAAVSESTSYIVKDIWLKADKAGDNLIVSFDFTGSVQNRDYLRIAFVDVTDTNKTYKVFANQAGTTAALTAEVAEGGELQTATVTNTAFGDTSLVDAWNGQQRHFQAYIYFEGQDPTCMNSTSIADVDVKFTFSLAEPTAQG